MKNKTPMQELRVRIHDELLYPMPPSGDENAYYSKGITDAVKAIAIVIDTMMLEKEKEFVCRASKEWARTYWCDPSDKAMSEWYNKNFNTENE